MKLSDAPIGLRVATVENMDLETRWTHYERREGIAKFTTNPKKPTYFVTAYRLRTVQGVVGEKPRYDSGEYRIETEVDGRIEVIDASLIPVEKESPKLGEDQRLPMLLAAFNSDHPNIIQAVDHVLITAGLIGIKPELPFVIGSVFQTEGKTALGHKRQWRITDIGSRTVTAICINEDKQVIDDPSWLNGPPYAVVEHSFDYSELTYWDEVSKENEKSDGISDNAV